MSRFSLTQAVPAPRLDAFDHLTDVTRLPEWLAPEIECKVIHAPEELKRGAEAHLELTRFGLTQVVRWRVEDVLRGSSLTFRQVEGIFKEWTQTMRFEELEDGTLVTEHVEYRMPGGLIGHLADDVIFRRDLERLERRRLKRARAHFAGA